MSRLATGRQDALARSSRFHGSDKLVARGVLQEIARRSCLDGRQYVSVGVVRRQDEDLREAISHNRLRRRDPAHVGHPEVHEHDVGTQGGCAIDRFLAIASLADDDEVWVT